MFKQIKPRTKLSNNIKKFIIAAGLISTVSSLNAKQLIEPLMVTIPAGSFKMGDKQQQAAQPIHDVSVNQFSLGKYEVTVAEFRQFIEATNYPAPTECRHELDGWFKLWTKGDWETNQLTKSEFQPVVCIDWNAATAYTQWLASETGRDYRLPTEAEWEYAARAGTTTDYHFGDDKNTTEICDYANTADLYGENILQREGNTTYFNWSSGMNNCSDNAAYASIVGMYKPNQFGLFDMISNVQEMLADCYVRGYEGAPTDGSARIEKDCESRSIRSGSWHWNNSPSAQRNSIGESFTGGVDGFRIALSGVAPKLSKSTKQFEQTLNQARQTEQKRRDLQPAFPDAITGLTLKQTDSTVTLNWQKSEQEDVKYYRVYRNALAGKMFKLLAANLTTTTFTDSTAGQHQYDYTVVAVRDHMQSHYAAPITIEARWLDGSAKIEAEWSHEFSGTQISWSSDNERGGHTLTGRDGISKDASITYRIEVAESGDYQLNYRIANNRAGKGFELYINDVKQSSNSLAATGGYHTWKTESTGRMSLKKGKNILKIVSLDDNWKMNWIHLKPIKKSN